MTLKNLTTIPKDAPARKGIVIAIAELSEAISIFQS